jgi:hypothetical protein
VEATQQEVPVSGSAFEGAEGMLGEGGPAPHHDSCVRLCHPRAMPIDHVLMLPAMDFAPPRLVGQAPRSQGTDATNRLQGGIANMQLAADILFVALHRPQFGSRRAAVDVRLRVVGKIPSAAACSVSTPRASFAATAISCSWPLSLPSLTTLLATINL